MQHFNFSAGPAMLPKSVLAQAQQELLNWQNTQSSVMELSHRGKEFIQCASTAEQDLRDILAIPNNYKVLFLQGGARAQFAAVPLNILGDNTKADYIISGYWSECAAKEAEKYCTVNRINIIKDYDGGKNGLQMSSDWALSNDSAYVHYCPNETIEGLAVHDDPNFKNKIVVADFSSSILSKPIDVAKYGIIYAGAQKNIGPSGITIVIVRDDLLNKAKSTVPSILNYSVQHKSDSMFNTPPTFAWYLSGLVFKWIKAQGGLKTIKQNNQLKAQTLYDFIDNSSFYQNNVAHCCRSIMNVPFKSPNETLDELFVSESQKAGITGVKGHCIVGGMRASIYNAMTLDGVNYLIQFMKDFEVKNC